jgi:hypothetical protein
MYLSPVREGDELLTGGISGERLERIEQMKIKATACALCYCYTFLSGRPETQKRPLHHPFAYLVILVKQVRGPSQGACGRELRQEHISTRDSTQLQ